MQQGQYPYLHVLDEILSDEMTAGETELGLLEIPVEKIVGTRSVSRTNAFALGAQLTNPEALLDLTQQLAVVFVCRV